MGAKWVTRKIVPILYFADPRAILAWWVSRDFRSTAGVALADPSNDPDNDPAMEFRLTYDGPLYATQRDPCCGGPPKHTENRHSIRRRFHQQLKALWEYPPLKINDGSPRVLLDGRSPRHPAMRPDDIAKNHAMYGFDFVPIVTQELDLMCGLDILMLRPDRPGNKQPWAGDIDNRLKTLLDALRIPEAGEHYENRVRADNERRFYVLLEDDKLITKVAVETDRLLEPIGEDPDASDTRLVITVRIRPFEADLFNLHFA